jgi:hypothetical protein
MAPSTGLFWYFFAEVFPRFADYFRFMFSAHPYIYIPVVTVIMRERPMVSPNPDKMANLSTPPPPIPRLLWPGRAALSRVL